MRQVIGEISFASIIMWTFIVILIVFSVIYTFQGHIAFDEGFNLQVPVSFATTGKYSTNYQYARQFDPLITTGPTLLLPIAGMFKVFGVGLIQARVIVFIYFVLFVWAMGFIIRRMSNSWGVILAIILLSLLPHVFFFSLKH